MREIVEELNKTIDTFVHYILKLPLSDLELSKTIHWGPREVLSHIVFWHEQYCVILRALLNNKKPNMLEGSFKDNNALAVRLYRNENREILVKKLIKAQNTLSVLCKNPQAKKIKIAFKVGGKIRFLPEALTKIESHIRSHQRQLIRAGFKIKSSDILN